MASLSTVSPGDLGASSNINQIVEALAGQANVPMSFTGVTDASLFAVDIKNSDPTNQRAFRVQDSSGQARIQADINGVALNQVAISSGTISGSTITNSRLTGASVSTASPGVLMARLDSTTLASSAASMTLTVTSSAYASLEVRTTGRCEDSTQQVAINLQLNADASTAYHTEFFQSSGVAATAAESTNSAGVRIGIFPGSSVAASGVGAIVADITHYNSTFNKIVLSRNGWAGAFGTPGQLIPGGAAGLWKSTASITSITLVPGTGFFSAGTRASLYGLP